MSVRVQIKLRNKGMVMKETAAAAPSGGADVDVFFFLYIIQSFILLSNGEVRNILCQRTRPLLLYPRVKTRNDEKKNAETKKRKTI